MVLIFPKSAKDNGFRLSESSEVHEFILNYDNDKKKMHEVLKNLVQKLKYIKKTSLNLHCKLLSNIVCLHLFLYYYLRTGFLRASF